MFPKLMRRPDVEKAVDLSCASIYRLMSEGRFPRPIRTGKRTVRWKAEDVSDWLESRPTSNSPAA